MDDDSCSKFITSLTKYLQSLCHSYVEFEKGVELVGYIYLNVDTGKKIDYVLNESVCKNGANVVKFTSNSFHAHPVDKIKEKEKEKALKLAQDSSKSSASESNKRKNDDDDVIIVGSEASRSRRHGTGNQVRPSHPNQGHRGVISSQEGQQRVPPGVFRSPQGPNPRMSAPLTYAPRGTPRQSFPRNCQWVGPMTGNNAMTQQAGAMSAISPTRIRHRQPYQVRNPQQQPQPRNFLHVGNYNSAAPASAGQPSAPSNTVDPLHHMAPPYTNIAQPRQPVPDQQGMNRVDNDVTFMREEYVAASHQQNAGRSTNQQGQIVTTTQGSSHTQPSGQSTVSGTSALEAMNQRFAYQQQAPYLQRQEHFQGQYPHPGQQHNILGSNSSQPGSAPGTGMMAANMQQSYERDTAGMGYVGVAATQSLSIFNQNSLAVSAATGNAVTVSRGMPLPVTTHTIFDDRSQASSSSTTSNLPVPSSSMVSSEVQPSLVIGQVWSESSDQKAASGTTNYQASQPLSSDNGAVVNTDTTNRFTGNSQFFETVGDMSQYQPGMSTDQSLPTSSSLSSQPISASQSGVIDRDAAQDIQHGTATSTLGISISESAAVSSDSASIAITSPFSTSLASSVLDSTETKLRVDPTQIGVAIATSVLNESTEAAVVAAPDMIQLNMIQSNYGFHSVKTEQDVVQPQNRSGSASSASLDAPSPVTGGHQLIGGSTELMTKIVQPQESPAYDSGCDSASTSAEKSSPQPYLNLRPLSIPLVPVDNSGSNSSSDDVGKKGRLEQDSWITDPNELGLEESTESEQDSGANDDDDDDDDDPPYTPSSHIKGTKRVRTRQSERTGGRGKKKKKVDTHSAPEQNTDADSEMLGKDDFPPVSLQSLVEDQNSSPEPLYKPGTFVLVHPAKDFDHGHRTRNVQYPAEVIATPKGQPEGLWVHMLVCEGNNLWRLPHVDQIVDHKIDPASVVRVLSNANVKIIGNKVFYKFDET